jgi:hypothetical protein
MIIINGKLIRIEKIIARLAIFLDFIVKYKDGIPKKINTEKNMLIFRI